jgi:hypothetical protein
VAFTRTEVVVPVPDGERLEQQRRHARVLACLVPRRVIAERRRVGVQLGSEHDRAAVPCDPQALDAAWRSAQHPGFATGGGQQPQRRGLVVVLLVGLHVGIRPRRHEQEGAVGKELGTALAGRRSRETDRRRDARGVELPDGVDHLLAVGRDPRDDHHEPGTIRREPQSRQPRHAEESIEIERCCRHAADDGRRRIEAVTTRVDLRSSAKRAGRLSATRGRYASGARG